jgi:hypothetical protein
MKDERGFRFKTFYFNTGVRIGSGAALCQGQIWRDGVKMIPFDCENVPDGAVFMFACDTANAPESKLPCFIAREIYSTSLLSKYAYFQIPTK